MLRETNLAPNDAARLDHIETTNHRPDAAGLGAELADASPEVCAAAVARSRRLPAPELIYDAWRTLSSGIQDQIGAGALTHSFYTVGVGISPCALTLEASRSCEEIACQALNAVDALAKAALPALYGTDDAEPMWAQTDSPVIFPMPAADLVSSSPTTLPSPIQFAIALHHHAWHTLQASSAFLDAADKADRKQLSWPAEDAEDEALTDLLMLSCRDRLDAIAMLAHLRWYLGVGHQHPKRPTPADADGALIAVRLRDLGMILDQEVSEAVSAPEPGAMADLIAAHRTAWSAYMATPRPEEIGWEAHFALIGAAGAAVEAVLQAPCAGQGEAEAFADHVRWYVAELAAAGEDLTDGFDYEAQQLRARAGDFGGVAR